MGRLNYWVILRYQSSFSCARTTLLWFVTVWIYMQLNHYVMSPYFIFLFVCRQDAHRIHHSEERRWNHNERILTWWKVLRWPGQSVWTMLGEQWWDTLDSSSVCRKHFDVSFIISSFIFTFIISNISFTFLNMFSCPSQTVLI